MGHGETGWKGDGRAASGMSAVWEGRRYKFEADVGCYFEIVNVAKILKCINVNCEQ